MRGALLDCQGLQTDTHGKYCLSERLRVPATRRTGLKGLRYKAR
jgi:hypothetical protein